MTGPHGLDRGLTNYGDRDFARFLRRSFARSMGLSTALLSQPVIGIASTPSDVTGAKPRVSLRFRRADRDSG